VHADPPASSQAEEREIVIGLEFTVYGLQLISLEAVSTKVIICKL